MAGDCNVGSLESGLRLADAGELVARFEFRSDTHPEPERHQRIREVWSRDLAMDIDLDDAAPPRFALRSVAAGAFGLSLFQGSRAAMRRSPEQAAGQAQELVLCISPDAQVRSVSHLAGERLHVAGDAHLWLASEGMRCEVDRDYRATMITAPLVLLRELGIDDVEACAGRGLAAGQPELRLLARYAALLVDDLPQLSPTAVAAACNHLRDLLGVALRAAAGAEVVPQRGSGAARLRLIKDDILHNLLRPGLSPNWVAARNGVSPRYLRELFAREQSCFTDFVLHARLALAHRSLRDPALRNRDICRIAYDCGFGDLSYFNRTFRRRYGVRPSDVRAS